MSEMDEAAERLRRVVAEVEDRIHVHTFRPTPPNPTNLEALRYVLDNLPQSRDVDEIRVHVEKDLLGSPENLQGVKRAAALVRVVKNTAPLQLALDLKFRAADALKTLSEKSKRGGTGGRGNETSREEGADPVKEIISFRDALAAVVQRAVDVNGLMSRSSDTLISSLVELQPSGEGLRRDYAKSYVPDAFIEELSVAMEVSARDLVSILRDHVGVFWQTQLVGHIEEAIKVASVKASDFGPAKLKERFPQTQLNELIHKACDDFALRMRKGGATAVVLPTPPPFNGLDIFKSAIRYPMQFVALATFIILPAATLVGFAIGATSAGPLLKKAIVFVCHFC